MIFCYCYVFIIHHWIHNESPCAFNQCTMIEDVENYISPKKMLKSVKPGWLDGNSMTLSATFSSFRTLFSASFWGLLYSESVFLVLFGERCKDCALTKLRELLYEKLLLFPEIEAIETDSRTQIMKEEVVVHVFHLDSTWLFYTSCSFVAWNSLS